MAKTRKTIITFLLGIVMCLSVCFGVVFAASKDVAATTATAETTYTTKDVAMMGRVAGWYGNGNFEIRLTLGDCDWTGESGQKNYNGELKNLLRGLDFFNKIKLAGKTLAEWGCTSCYGNYYWLNSGEPKYTLMIPLSMSKATEAAAAGVTGGTPVTILEGALIPSYAYLQGDATATVYRAACDYETQSWTGNYGIYAVGKTEVDSVKYVQGYDGTCGYFGVSLEADDYATGVQKEHHGANYGSSEYAANRYDQKVLVNGEAGKARGYGLFNLGSKGQGYFAFQMFAPESEMQSFTIPAGTNFPMYAMYSLSEANGHTVTMMYQTETDVTFYKYPDGTWQKELEETQTDIASIYVDGGATDNFTVFKLTTHDYPNIGTYGGESLVTTKQFLSYSNFYSHVLVDDVAIGSTNEAYVNVWSNRGSLAIRTSKGTSASKITVLAGCQFPTYKALETGVREAFVTTRDVTYIKNANGEWVEFIPEGDFDTAVTQVQFGRSTNVLNINLSVNDYPTPTESNAATYNVGVDAEKILALNLFDNIVVDGYTLRARYNNYGAASATEPWIWINKFVGHNFALRIPSEDGADIGASKIVIRAGTQFPSMEYLNNGAEMFYVTTEEVTYVKVSNNKEVSWDRQGKLSFVADGKTVATCVYTQTNGIQGAIPEVPAKAGYKGAWESYTLTGGDIVVKAVYTKHDYTEIETNISKIQYEEGFVILYLTNNDYPTNEGTLDVKGLMSDLHFFDYLEVDGKMMAQGLQSISGAFINVWGRYGSLATYLPNHYTPTTSIVFKKGCQIPTNANRLDGENKTCYVLENDVTFLYENGEWVRQSNGEEEVPSSKPAYENDYVLSDLYNTGHVESAELEKGYLLVDKSTQGKVYGYNVSQSFSLAFDFTLNLGDKDIAALGNYTTFNISMSTRGYNWSNGFGWNFYLYRPGNTQKCVEFTYSGAGYGTTEWLGVFEKGVTYRVTLGYKLLDTVTGTVETYININGEEAKKTVVLGEDYARFALTTDSISFSTNNALTNAVRISDPGMTETDERRTLTLSDGTNTIFSGKVWKYTLPELSAYDYGKTNNVFIGWTTNTSTLEALYPAGYTFELTENVTLYPVWLQFAMRNGAAVRTYSQSGLRFLVDVDAAGYQLGVSKNVIKGVGTLIVPTSYLDSGLAFVHESFPEGYYMDMATETWGTKTDDTWTYAAALINISPAQYARSMSARGYLKIAYTTGEAYVYTDYSKDLHARSIYQVATSAYNDNQKPDMVLAYVNAIADVTLTPNLEVTKTAGSAGDYTLTSTKEGSLLTLTFSKSVKGLVINGTRILAGYTADVVVGGAVYVVSGYKLSSNGLTATFNLDVGATEVYCESVVEYYKNSDAYSELHKNVILSILNEWGGNYTDAQVNAEYLEKLASVKTQVEVGKDVGSIQLDTPVLSLGLGYTVVWNAVNYADYYVVTDDNDYRNGVYVLATEELVYKTEVVGNHNVTVTAYSFYEDYTASNASKAIKAVEVKPVFSYKAMSDGLYKFSESDMVKMGIVGNKSELNTKNDGSSFYYDSGEKLYFAYYNKDFGWSKNQGNATDWTSPAHFPAHAERLKAMGNNLILLSENTNAAYKEADTWATSRLKYVMDTAWSLGMKVIVCDDVLYAQSKTVKNQSTAASTIASRQGFSDYVTHPAFYGFSLEDEPEKDEVDNVGYMVKALKEACAKLGLSKENGNEPFFLACLYQKNFGFSTGISGNYNDYLASWAKETGLDYLYVDLYTGHAMGDSTNRYTTTYEAVYSSSLGVMSGELKFHQAITAHTQNKGKEGTLTEQDMYMSMLYAAAHNVAGYSWFCYFPIADETKASMVGYDGNGYGNGLNGLNNASGSYYNAASIAGYQFELIQGLFNGYSLKTRDHSSDLLTTTLSNGSKTITMYVNADVQNMSTNKTVTISGSTCYLIGYGVGTAAAPYQVTTAGSVTLAPGQAVICIG